MPPLPERFTTTVTIKRYDKNSVELCLELLRNDEEGGPPSRDASFRRQGKNFVSKLDVPFGLLESVGEPANVRAINPISAGLSLNPISLFQLKTKSD